ncbi:MAG: 16S rRNA (cytidine(1402)-2'-O)-methyltransferase [Campylobacterales bacterium]
MLLFVSTPIGNLEDITLRALKALEEASIVLCEDTRVSSKLIRLYEDRALIKKTQKKYISLHSHNEDEFLADLETDFFSSNVIYLSDAGAPCISDPGAKLVLHCLENGVLYDFLPGASALISGYGMSGFVEGRFLFIGFLPHGKKLRVPQLQKALFSGYVSIYYESPKRIVQLVEEIVELDEKREVFAIKEITKLHQKSFKHDAKKLLELLKQSDLRGEWTLVVDGSNETLKCATLKELETLALPPKVAAKIEAFFLGVSPKEIYKRDNSC